MQFEILLLDLKAMFADIRPHDFGPMVFWGIWSIALFSSLRGVDRRDEIAQVTYMGVLMTLGAFLFLVLPLGQTERKSAVEKIVILALVLLIPSLRWMFERKKSELDKALVNAWSANKNKKNGGK